MEHEGLVATLAGVILLVGRILFAALFALFAAAGHVGFAITGAAISLR